MGRQSVDQLQLGLHQQQGDDTEGSLVSMAEVGGPYAGAGTITGNVAGIDSCPIGWDPIMADVQISVEWKMLQ